MNDLTPNATTIPRRRILIGGTGVAIGALAALTASAPASADPPVIPVLTPTDDWATVLSTTPQVQLVPGATYTLSSPVSVPSGTVIFGNGATLTVDDDTTGALIIAQVSDVTIIDLAFLGRSTDPLNSSASFAHVGVRVERSTNVTIERCRFRHWRGAGVVVSGSGADAYMAYATKITGSTFSNCYFGVSITDRSEYGLVSDNHFLSCRLAVWNSSGNWSLSGNVIVNCYGALYTIAASSPYGTLVSDNWAHGAVIGNTINHASEGFTGRWTSNTGFPIGGVIEDPGSGIVVRGVLPPTFSGNSVWYADISATDLEGTRWLLSGCTLSDLTVSCAGVVPIHLLGTQSSAGASQPSLSGNVVDLHPL